MKILLDYPVNEVFTSIQGEGKFSGRNSLFIRFNYCNLRCGWCDTKETWAPLTEAPTSAAVLNTMIAASQSPDVVLTGGEPLLFAIDQLQFGSKNIHIETNGTLDPLKNLDSSYHHSHFSRKGFTKEFCHRVYWTVSPKLASYPHEESYQALQIFSQFEKVIFKFVLTDIDAGLEAVKKMAADVHLPKEKIYIAFEGTDAGSQLKKTWLETVINEGYHYSPRLQVLFWGNEKGR